MFKKLLFVFLISSIRLVAQNADNLSLYTVNKYVVNPAYTGYKDSLFASFEFRNQMTGIKGSQKEIYFNLHSPITKNVAIGGSFNNVTQGVFTVSSPALSIAYKVNIAKDNHIFFGLNGGINKQGVNNRDLGETDLTDPLLTNNAFQETSYTFGAGLMYVVKSFEISLAAPTLNKTNGRINNFVGYLEYNRWATDKILIKPTARIRKTLVNTYIADINFLARYKEKVWAQLGYRSTQILMASAGVTVQGVGLGICYELPFSKSNTFTNSNIEVLAFLQFPDFKKRRAARAGM